MVTDICAPKMPKEEMVNEINNEQETNNPKYKSQNETKQDVLLPNSNKDLQLKSQLQKLKALSNDGLLPADVYKQAASLAASNYLSTQQHDIRSVITSPSPSIATLNKPNQPNEQNEQKKQNKSASTIRDEILWKYACPLILLMFTIIFGLILFDWILGIDTPRIVDYILNPLTTVGTHRTGRTGDL